MEPSKTFRGLVVEAAGAPPVLRDLPLESLPAGDVRIAVDHSSLNYKDGLAITGKGPILQSYPMVPGIDLAGTVVESDSPAWKPGDRVILTGWGIGERHWGGYAQQARVKSAWLVPLPEGMTTTQAMAIGTAGFTAMLCVLALEERGLTPERAAGREIVVTGAAGGVGSVAVALLAKLGYNVTAVSGRAEARDYLRELGARQVIGRDELPLTSRRPIESQRWAGGVDVVGGDTLVAVLRQAAYESSIACCGMAGGTELSTSVFPFILRGVGLLGVESVTVPFERRLVAWSRLARDLPPDALACLTQVVSLAEVPRRAEDILAGKVRGRVVVEVPE